MKANRKFSLWARVRSMGFALEGVKSFFIAQHNVWIHCAAAIAAISLGIYAGLDSTRWFMLVISISIVFMSELFNTAIEYLCDIISPDIHPQIKIVKDLAAAAVLVSAITSAIVGLIVFWPLIRGWFASS